MELRFQGMVWTPELTEVVWQYQKGVCSSLNIWQEGKSGSTQYTAVFFHFLSQKKGNELYIFLYLLYTFYLKYFVPKERLR